MVTLQERQKAEKLIVSQGKKDKKPRGPLDNKMKGFSTGEKDLYKEIGHINKRDLMETKAAE